LGNFGEGFFVSELVFGEIMGGFGEINSIFGEITDDFGEIILALNI
jgi:hypothetical protein